MSEIVCKTQTGKEIVCETMVTDTVKALKYWTEMGMSNVTYFARKVKFIPKAI